MDDFQAGTSHTLWNGQMDPPGLAASHTLEMKAFYVSHVEVEDGCCLKTSNWMKTWLDQDS